jgi:hypothetical protein
MEKEFPATIKLITGEEVFAIVNPYNENDKDFLILYEPVIITEVRTLSGSHGYKIEPWLKTADDDMFLIHRDKIITLSECKNKDTIKYHLKFIREKNKQNSVNPNEEKLTKEQGYISNVKEMKDKLEKLFNNSLKE